MLRAVADFTDLKSPVLIGHSPGVAALAETAAVLMGRPEAEVRTVRRAAWLQEISAHSEQGRLDGATVDAVLAAAGKHGDSPRGPAPALRARLKPSAQPGRET